MSHSILIPLFLSSFITKLQRLTKSLTFDLIYLIEADDPRISKNELIMVKFIDEGQSLDECQSLDEGQSLGVIDITDVTNINTTTSIARLLEGSVDINGEDDEWFSSNEKVSRRYPLSGVFLSINQPSVTLDIPFVRWGGECRVEVVLIARLVEDGQIRIEGNAKLFEGVSEDTQDLEEEKVVNFLVPRTTKSNPLPAFYTVELNNTEIGGGDKARIDLSLTNHSVEE